MKKTIETTVCDWCGQEKGNFEQMHRVYFENEGISGQTVSVQEPLDLHESCKKQAIISAVRSKQACKNPTPIIYRGIS